MMKIDNIGFSYEDKRVLKGIDLELDAGEILGILGPNGSGKSTTMKMLACFLPPDSGTESGCRKHL